MKKILSAVLLLMLSAATFAQRGTDTVVVELAKTSRMVFTIKDKNDLEQLKQYDFQAMFDDILARLEKKDSVIVIRTPGNILDKHIGDVDLDPDTGETDLDLDSEFDEEWAKDLRDHDDNRNTKRHITRYHRTRHAFNIDLGLNSYLEDGKFPDEEGQPYAIRPWGSWYFGLSSVQRTSLSEHFYLEWALGVSWYNFKFENDNTVILKNDSGISFEEDFRDVSFIKSKLGIVYLNASFIPMFSFGRHTYSAGAYRKHSGFRIGAGPYAGYRIGSYSKQVYKENGDRERDRNRDNFYLNNFRYGMRLQIGVRSADFFFAYDMNELFAPDKGPKLNAFSFGITF